jgi:rRNA maturation endonuclease Nob1
MVAKAKVHVDLVCGACKHAFSMDAETLLKDEEKNCPECGSQSVRQTFSSYLRNGPLLDPRWGSRSNCTHFG